MLRNIGSFRHIINLERNTPTNSNQTNELIDSWAAVVEDVPCHVETVTGGEIRRGRQMQAVTTHLIRMHHPQGAFTVGTKDRLNWVSESMLLNVISAIDPDGMKRELEIQAKADG